MTNRINRLKHIVKTESHDDTTETEDLRKYIQYLITKNKKLHTLNEKSHFVIKNLEMELQAFRDNEKDKYDNTVKVLENNIFNQNRELETQKTIILRLLEQKKSFQMQIKCLKEENEEKLRKIQSLTNEYEQNDLGDVEHWKQRYAELQEKLVNIQTALASQVQNEKRALKIVEDTLCVVDSVVIEKNNAIKREHIVKDECAHLASAIGHVMHEAAKKVEKEMSSKTKKYELREMELNNVILQLSDNCKFQHKYRQILEAHCNRLDKKFADSISETTRLTNELSTANGIIDGLEEKILERDNFILKGKKLQRIVEEHGETVKKYIENHKKLDAKYKSIIAGMSKEFEDEVDDLENRNDELKEELKQKFPQFFIGEITH